MTSKSPINDQISWLSSHAAGVMKAHPLTEAQEEFWQVVLNVTNHVTALEAAQVRKIAEFEKRVAVLETQLNSLVKREA